jgi:serine protease inhibitor
MSKVLTAILVLCIGIGFMQCTGNTTSPIPRELTKAEKQLVESDNKFGLKLFKEINKAAKDSNVFISPLSVSMALGMTYNGADGSTKEAMENTLELNDLTIQEVNESYKSLIDLLAGLDPKVIFEIANSIWYRQNWSFEEEFTDQCKAYFNAEVKELDFNDPNALNIINEWVEENTNGKIKKIVMLISFTHYNSLYGLI